MFNTKNIRIVAIHTRKYFASEYNKNEIDAIDKFTTQLLQKKSDKWEMIRKNKNAKYGEIKYTLKKLFSKTNNIEIRGYSTEQIDELLAQTLDICDNESFILLLHQCIDYKIEPSFKMIEKAVAFCAQHGLRDLILLLQQYATEIYPDQLKLNSNFDHYLAELIWVRGNITDSLSLFEKVYHNNQYLRRKVRFMLKCLITNTISQRSEAALINITNFVEILVERYNDHFLLACVWQVCFLSDWYTDNCMADEILQKHIQLLSIITNRVPYIIHFALREHKPDTAYRLFEILLQHNMKPQYTMVLQALFNYRYRNNDFRSCAEIIQWSVKFEVPLLTSQHQQFISLLLVPENSKEQEDTSKISKPPKFHYKF